MLSSMEATNEMSQSRVDIRTQFSQMSNFMMDLAKKMDAVLNRRDGIPPEVNVCSQRDQHQGSEVSSVLGDPAQTATFDVSKPVSQVSSAVEQSLAATHRKVIVPAGDIPIISSSPTKKK
jgi:hypothetical protein